LSFVVTKLCLERGTFLIRARHHLGARPSTTYERYCDDGFLAKNQWVVADCERHKWTVSSEILSDRFKTGMPSFQSLQARCGMCV